jgi:NADP-dependent 3-hydroxy acid dehydrogenase YdfG
MTRARTGRLAGTTALVTGASWGLGRAVANADAREGYLLLDGRRPEPLECVREEVEALVARAVGGAVDVGDAAAAMGPLNM